MPPDVSQINSKATPSGSQGTSTAAPASSAFNSEIFIPLDAASPRHHLDSDRTAPEEDSSGVHERLTHSSMHFSVANDVVKFYEHYNDRLFILYDNLPPLTCQPQDLSAPALYVIRHCTSSQMTLGEARKEFELIATFDRRLPPELRSLSVDFKEPDSFVNYLAKLRKWKVRDEGWHGASIRTAFGENRPGVLRSIMGVLREQLDQRGGIHAIRPFSKDMKSGKRAFSCPVNSNAMQEYEKHNQLGGIVMGIDLYSDGTTLAKSGSQSANTVRVRFVNVEGIENEWHDVGIAPTI